MLDKIDIRFSNIKKYFQGKNVPRQILESADFRSHYDARTEVFSLPYNRIIDADEHETFVYMFSYDQIGNFFLLLEVNATIRYVKDCKPIVISYSFKPNYCSEFTMREMSNLLRGRWVCKMIVKRGKEFESWLQLDMGQLDSRGQHPYKSYKHKGDAWLIGLLRKFCISEALDDQISRFLLVSLKKGNLYCACFSKGGKVSYHSIAINAQFHTLDFFSPNISGHNI